MRAIELTRQAWRASSRAAGVFARDVGHGLLEVSHNTLALVGLAAVAAALFATGRPELRQQVEVLALEWLQDRHEQRALASGNVLAGLGESDAVARATAANPERLSKEQAAVVQWLARRYRVAPEPVAALVQEAWAIGERARLEPTLILAVIAIESSFNPFAQSPVGAQGLMQVMTRVHDEKYSPFGGTHAAFDPITNLRVGVQVLKDCIARAGGVAEGLRHYVGAALLESDGGYATRVLAEQAHLRAVAEGRRVPPTVPNSGSPAPEKVAALQLGGEPSTR
ncbi:MAG: transglycosylase SLT domain-containing protein [Rubrivivax sp.]|nr:transglycosylase SLT domain-containing protein [Rubrivivax sp.]